MFIVGSAVAIGLPPFENANGMILIEDIRFTDYITSVFAQPKTTVAIPTLCSFSDHIAFTTDIVVYKALCNA